MIDVYRPATRRAFLRDQRDSVAIVLTYSTARVLLPGSDAEAKVGHEDEEGVDF